MRLRFICWLAVLLASLPSLMHAAPSGWLRVSGDNVIIYSDGSEKALTEFAVRYAAFRNLFAEFFVPPGKSLPPSTFILLSQRENQRDYLPEQDPSKGTVVNYSVILDDRAFMAMSMSGTRQHAINRAIEFETMWSIGRLGYFSPLWMTQGAGRVMASFTVVRGKYVFIESAEELGWWQYFRHGTLPWPRLFEIDTASPEYTGKSYFGMFNAQSAVLMDWILLSGPNTRERFSALSRQLSRHSEPEALQAVMHVPVEKLTQTLAAHHDSPQRRKEFSFDEETARAQVKISPVAEAEITVLLANILAAQGKRDRSEALLAHVRRREPVRPEVWETLARSARNAGDPDEAIRLYREAIAAGSTNAFTYITSARARLNSTSSGGSDRAGGGGQAAESALAELKKAIALDPTQAATYIELGRAGYLLPTPDAALLEDLNQGLGLIASDWRIRYYRALLYSRLDRTTEATADLRLLVEDPELADKNKRIAQMQLSFVNFGENSKKIQALVQEHKFDEARTLAKQAERQEADHASSQRYADLVRWVDAQERQQ